MVQNDVVALVDLLRALRAQRSYRKARAKSSRAPRRMLAAAERRAVLDKTGGRCHICGGDVAERWQADHVLAHSGAGMDAKDNYLAAHSLCNNYRWDYMLEEFQLILKLGVWLRTQIERQTDMGRLVAEQFVVHERRRVARRVRRRS